MRCYVMFVYAAASSARLFVCFVVCDGEEGRCGSALCLGSMGRKERMRAG